MVTAQPYRKRSWAVARATTKAPPALPTLLGKWLWRLYGTNRNSRDRTGMLDLTVALSQISSATKPSTK